jgi:hypothetical protein
MKIKIGDKIYDGEKEPIMVILTQQDKRNIVNMSPECTKYCVYPDNLAAEEIEFWMKTE